jgi:hypothetical protein
MDRQKSDFESSSRNNVGLLRGGKDRLNRIRSEAVESRQLQHPQRRGRMLNVRLLMYLSKLQFELHV